MNTLNSIKRIVIKDYQGSEEYFLTDFLNLDGFNYDLCTYITDSGERIHGVRVFPPTKKGVWVELNLLGHNHRVKLFLSNKNIRIEKN